MTLYQPIRTKARYIHITVSDDGKTLNLRPHRIRCASSIFNEEFLVVDKGQDPKAKDFSCSMTDKRSKDVVEFILPSLKDGVRLYWNGYSDWESVERYVTQQAPQKLKDWALKLKEYELEFENV